MFGPLFGMPGTPLLAYTGIDKTPKFPKYTSSFFRALEPERKPCQSDYETSKLISSGAFGAVYLVRHKEINKIFAMKKQDKQNLIIPRKLNRVFLERDIMTFAECPFVASVYSSFPSKHHLCMVMEYVGGGDCGTLLKNRGRLPVNLARLYFAEIVLALEYLHSYGVVHRDLKPDNILITPSGHIKVTDFGLAKLGLMRLPTNICKVPTQDITREFRDSEVCGTPLYLAPEVILKEGYGRPVDWWSAGIILYEFLMGHEPFHGKDKLETYTNIVCSDITWGSDNTAPPPDAQDIIIKLLRKNPAHRLGTGGADEIKSHPFLRDLDFENILSQEPEYVPRIVSDMDTRLFDTRSEKHQHMVSEEDTGEEIDCPEFQNFFSSSQRLNKLYSTIPRMLNTKDPKSFPQCFQWYSVGHSEMQKQSSDSESDGDTQHHNAISSSSFSSTVSGGVNETKVLPFLRDLDSDSTLSREPEYVPQLVSEMNNRHFEGLFAPSVINHHMVSEEDETNCRGFNNFGSSSQDYKKLYINLPGMMDIEDPMSPPGCSPGSSAGHLKMQKESSLSQPDGYIQRHIVRSSSSSSSTLPEIPVLKKRKSIFKLIKRQPKAEKVEKENRTKGSIMHRLFSSCRRGLSRAVRNIGGSSIFSRSQVSSTKI